VNDGDYDEHGDYDEQDDDQEEDDYDDWGDDDDYPEPDGADSEIARSYEEYDEHCDTVHGGGHCDCRPSARQLIAQRAAGAARWLHGIKVQVTVATWGPHTLRIGPAELTVRARADRGCGACQGRGFLYTLTPKPEHPIPPGHNGAALCGCGSATAQLAATRRWLRRELMKPPF
jgi:hypothetical protein